MPACASMTVVFVESSSSTFPVTPAKAGVPFGFFEFFSKLLEQFRACQSPS